MGLTNTIREFFPWSNKLQQTANRLNDGDLVLDLGCGKKGSLRKVKVKRNLKIYGVDAYDPFDKEMFFEFTRLDISNEKLPFDDNFFDFIILNHVLEHIINPLDIMIEINRVLKKGGYLYIETPSTRSLFLPSLKASKKDDSPINFFDDPSHLRPYNKCSISRVCRQANFSIDKVGLHPDLARLFMSPVYLIVGILTLNRGKLARGLRSLVGWAVFCIARK